MVEKFIRFFKESEGALQCSQDANPILSHMEFSPHVIKFFTHLSSPMRVTCPAYLILTDLITVANTIYLLYRCSEALKLRTFVYKRPSSRHRNPSAVCAYWFTFLICLHSHIPIRTSVIDDSVSLRSYVSSRNYTEQSSCEATSGPAGLEIPCLLWSPVLEPVFTQLNQVHAPTSCSFKIHFGIILRCAHKSPSFRNMLFLRWVVAGNGSTLILEDHLLSASGRHIQHIHRYSSSLEGFSSLCNAKPLCARWQRAYLTLIVLSSSLLITFRAVSSNNVCTQLQ
jgi:hypothetical protein